MGKVRNGRKSTSKTPKKRALTYSVPNEYTDDEIDAFHKQRDVVPLDINDDAGDSDEENELPVLDIKDASDEEDDEEADIEDDAQLTGLAAKIARGQRYLRAKIGGVEDETRDDSEDEDDKRVAWGRSKNLYYNADNVDYEIQSSDDDLPAEEEAEVLRLQKEKAKAFSMEDFGIEDLSQDESDGEPTLEEILVKGKGVSKDSAENGAQADTSTAYEVVAKDLNALSREEQMDVLYSSAPELVGLLSELKEAIEQLENKVDPVLEKVIEEEKITKSGMKYLELKKQLLLSYCQAITFYLLLKSEGQPVRDHPVIARLVEIKSLLDKVKQLDANLPYAVENILNEKSITAIGKLSSNTESNAFKNDLKSFLVSSEAQKPREEAELVAVDSLRNSENGRKQIRQPREEAELVKVDSSRNSEDGRKRNRQNDQLGLQSMEMLRVRAALEEKLKQKGICNYTSKKDDGTQKNRGSVNGKLEGLDDFDDDARDGGRSHSGMSDGHSNLSQLMPQIKKSKVISGDDDIPKRDDIGERRRKHESRVLAGAGIKLDDDDHQDENMERDGEEPESDLEFYKQVERERAAKLAAKAEKYSRTQVPSLSETFVEGKRQISYQMEKNRGLTRARKKLTKNPRKKYKLKHQKAVVSRKGQVREVKRPSGPYGGEAAGINARISRSIRFKN